MLHHRTLWGHKTVISEVACHIYMERAIGELLQRRNVHREHRTDLILYSITVGLLSIFSDEDFPLLAPRDVEILAHRALRGVYSARV